MSEDAYQIHVYRNEQVPSKYHGRWKVKREDIQRTVEFKDYEETLSPVVAAFDMAPPLARLVSSYLVASPVVPASKPEAGSPLADFYAPPVVRRPIPVDDDDDTLDGVFG
jgi:hypothetical protein